MPMVSPHTFQHFGLPVNDLKRAKDFYLDVVGLKCPDEGDPGPDARQVRLYAGDNDVAGQQLVLFLRRMDVERDSLAARKESLRLVREGDTTTAAELVEDGRTHHAWVITPEEFKRVPAELEKRGVEYCLQNRGHEVIYFFDPDGNQLQLTDQL